MNCGCGGKKVDPSGRKDLMEGGFATEDVPQGSGEQGEADKSAGPPSQCIEFICYAGYCFLVDICKQQILGIF